MGAEQRRQVHGTDRELSILFEVSQILDSSLDMRSVVEPVREALGSYLGCDVAVPQDDRAPA